MLLDVMQNLENPTESTMNQEKAAYEKKYRAQLDEWQASIDKLSAKARKADAEAQVHMTSYVNDIRAKKAALEERLQRINAASNDAWSELKHGVEEAANDLSAALSNAKSKLS